MRTISRISRETYSYGFTTRRVWPLTTKLKILREVEQSGTTMSEVARRHGLSPKQLCDWRRKYAVKTVPTPRLQTSESLTKRVEDLERLLGKKLLEITYLRERLGIFA